MIDIQKTARVIEALIFASPAPVPRRALLPYLENEDQITEVLASIAARYDEQSGIELSDIEGHYAFRTRADVAAFLTLSGQYSVPYHGRHSKCLLSSPTTSPSHARKLKKYVVLAYHGVRLIFCLSWAGLSRGAGGVRRAGRLHGEQALLFLIMLGFKAWMNCRVLMS